MSENKDLLNQIQAIIEQGRKNHFASAFGAMATGISYAMKDRTDYLDERMQDELEEINNQSSYHATLVKLGHKFLKEYEPKILAGPGSDTEKEFMYKNAMMEKLGSVSEFSQTHMREVIHMPYSTEDLKQELDKAKTVQSKYLPLQLAGVTGLVTTAIASVAYVTKHPVAAALIAAIPVIPYVITKIMLAHHTKELGITKEEKQKYKKENLTGFYCAGDSGIGAQEETYKGYAEIIDIFRHGKADLFVKKADDDYGVVKKAEYLLSNAAASRKGGFTNG